jgi:hypothetical protein
MSFTTIRSGIRLLRITRNYGYLTNKLIRMMAVKLQVNQRQNLEEIIFRVQMKPVGMGWKLI